METDATGMPAPILAGKVIKHKRNVPVSDMELGSLSEFVSAHWQQNPWLSLRWLTADKFMAQVRQYRSLLMDKHVQHSGRPRITGTLKELDKEINRSIGYVKGYLANKYGKEKAPSYYASFGIVRRKHAYIIPLDHTLRKAALVQLRKGLALEDFTNHTYGIAFWNSIQQKFDSYLDQAIQTDSGVARKTGDKNILKKELLKGLNAIVWALKAHSPDTWKAELRNWGFQKEKY